MGTTTGNAMLNGIDVGGLTSTIDAIRGDSAKGQTRWTIKSRWMGGTRSDHVVDGCRIGGSDVERRFLIQADEPVELCGTNLFANPQEYLLSAMNACMIVGYAAVAALMGVRLTHVEIETWGDIDLRGFLGIDGSVAPGYESLRQTVRLAGDAPDARLEQIHEVVKATSPNYFNITRAIATRTRLQIG